MLSKVRGILVFAFFLFMMSRLVRDHVLPSWEQGEARSVSAAMFVDGWVDRDEWTSLSVGGVGIGGMRTRTLTLSNEFGMTSHLLVGAGGVNANVRMGARLDQKLALQQFEVSVNLTGSKGGPVRLMGRVYNGILKLKVTSDTGVRFHRIKLDAPITALDVVNPLFTSKAVQEGQTYSISVYDPVWKAQMGQLKVKLTGPDALPQAGRNLMCRKLSAELNNVVMYVWVDDEGVIWKREIPIPGLQSPSGASGTKGPSLVLDRIEAEKGKAMFPELVSTDLLPELGAEDFEGQDQGDPTAGLGIIPMLLAGGAKAVQ